MPDTGATSGNPSGAPREYPRVAVRVDGAVRSHQPVASAARRPGDPDDRRLTDDALSRHGAEERRPFSVAEDASVGTHQPVAPAIGC